MSASPAGPQKAHRTPRFLGALSEDQFRRYTLGTFVWGSAHQLITLVQGYTLFKLTDSTLYLAALGGSVGAMAVIMPIAGGFLNDRLPRKRLLLTGSAAMTLAMALVTALYAAGDLQPWQVLVAGSVQGAFLGLDWTTRQALLPAVVSRPRLVSAVSVDLASFNLARIAAPLVGGAVLAKWGGPSAYGLISGLFASSVLVALSLQPAPFVARDGVRPIWGDLKEVAALLKGDQVLSVNMLFTAVNALMLGGIIYLLPAFAEREIGTGERGLSWLFTAVGLGALVASIAMSVIGAVRRAGAWLIASDLAFAALVVGFAASGSLGLALAAAAALGFFNSVHITLGAAAIQLASPEAMRGRVFGVYEVAWGLFPLGGLVLGTLASWTGLAWALVAGAALVALCSVGVWAWSPKIRGLGFRT